MRERARTAVSGLARLAARGAMVRQRRRHRGAICRSTRSARHDRPARGRRARAGRRRASSRVVRTSTSRWSRARARRGRSRPGTALQAGTLNLTGPLTIVATAAAQDSFLAEMVAADGGGRSRPLRAIAASPTAPRGSTRPWSIRRPSLTFVGWMLATGDWHRAHHLAIAVLIITCPCALGLAVPMVQVVAARRLFERGIMVKDGGALERLAEIDTVVFDKTGTLTAGGPRLVDARRHRARTAGDRRRDGRAFAPSLFAGDRRRRPRRALPAVAFGRRRRVSGPRLEARIGGTSIGSAGRTGRCGVPQDGRPGRRAVAGRAAAAPLRLRGRAARRRARGRRRADGQGPAAWRSCPATARSRCAALAATLGVPYIAGVLPADKVARIAALAAAGRKVLMVGDGLNDAPALAAAHVSMAPATAGRYRPQRRRLRLPARRASTRCRRRSTRARARGPGPAELRARRRLQRARRADRDRSAR